MIQITTMSNANIEIDKDSVLNLNSVAGRNTEFVQVSTATVTSYSVELAVTVTNDQTRPRDHAVGGTFRDIALYLSLKSCIALAGTFILKDPDRSGGPLLNYKTSR